MTRHEILVPRPRNFRSPSPISHSLIEWQVSQPGLWSGQIGLDFAGLIEVSDESYLVTDWRGDPIGSFGTLSEAQLSLEPAHRAELREKAEKAAMRASLATTGALLVVAVGSVPMVGAWLTSMI